MEGGRRISASPRPCSGRRVVAKKRARGGGVDGFVNSVKKLQRREICSKRDRAFSMSDAQERFRNIRLQVSSLMFSTRQWHSNEHLHYNSNLYGFALMLYEY
jgi:hypothetical protein